MDDLTMGEKRRYEPPMRQRDDSAHYLVGFSDDSTVVLCRACAHARVMVDSRVTTAIVLTAQDRPRRCDQCRVSNVVPLFGAPA